MFIVKFDVITNFFDSFQARIAVDFFVITRRNLKSEFNERLKNYVKTLNERQNRIRIRIDRRLKIIIKFQK